MSDGLLDCGSKNMQGYSTLSQGTNWEGFVDNNSKNHTVAVMGWECKSVYKLFRGVWCTYIVVFVSHERWIGFG